jgi:hypothetical protein
MRIIVGFALLLCACGSPKIETGSTDQGTSAVDLAAAASDLASPSYADMAGIPHVCSATCSQCAGACCGTACCAPGEWCDPKTVSCRCGDGPSCSTHEICVGNTADSCGISCQPVLH